MATYDDIRPAAPGTAPRAPISTLLARLLAWFDYRATRRALSRLTDGELHDIGLSRADIDRVARTR
ncbi:DUF1127 domain-containing protein [Jannaschia sp. LMIT008]|uniref:DUF1127 domain-containing protein n=1 Tax=Jannaschia maritima TaxID=3032585 RepID=UPI002810DB63|nr:DUF1127 domain-containing protein [Jannaschia sp. LMIT008]